LLPANLIKEGGRLVTTKIAETVRYPFIKWPHSL